MALVVADRVQETTTTTGTGTYTLAGAKDGFQSFAAVGNSNTTYYACTDGTDYEVGIGTYTLSGTTLARTTIIESSNSDAAVNWGAGEKDIFVTLPASKATVLDASGKATFSGDVTVEENLVIGDDSLTSNEALVIRGDNATANAATIKIAYGNNDTHWLMLSDGSSQSTILARNRALAIGTRFNQNVSIVQNNTTIQSVTSTGISVTGNITVSGTVDGRDVATDGTKLDGIEASADVTDATNVAAAGAAMTTGATFTGDVTFNGTAGMFGTPYVFWDKSANDLKFRDSASAVFGNSEVLEIYHFGSSYIDVKNGTSANLNIRNLADDRDINIQSDNGSGGVTDYFVAEGSTGEAQLFHYGSEKLATKTGGVEVTGTVTATSFSGDGSALTNLPSSGVSLAVAIALG